MRPHDEHRARRRVDEPGRDPAGEEPPGGAPAVGAHHDQLRVVLARLPADLLDDEAVRDDGGAVNSLRHGGRLHCSQERRHAMVLGLRELGDDVRVPEPGVADRGDAGVRDGDDEQRRLEPLRQLEGLLLSLFRLRRAVGGKQDRSRSGHLTPPFYAVTRTSCCSTSSWPTGVASSTTLSARLSAAAPKTSYASSTSARAKRWVANVVGSRRPASISLSSFGVVVVSTSPVVIRTSRIHSFSRWSVAGWPWTPTLATRPPGRISSAQSSNVSGTPTASMATSAPRPPVSFITFATASSRPLSIVTSAPNSTAFSSREASRSIATMR